MSHFTIQKLDYKKDGGSLLEFFKKIYSPNHILTNKEFFEWQFVAPKHKNFIVKKDEQIISHAGIIDPSFVAHNKKVRVGFWACLITDLEYRNGGVGVFLNREIEKEMDVVYSTGINQEGMKLFKGLGWTEVGNLHRWVIKKFEKTDNQAVEIKNFDASWDDSWNKIKNRFVATIDRTSEYLNWRFISHPKIKYQVFGIKAKEGYDGYMVLRLEEGEMKAVRIVDLIAKDEQTEKELLRAALNYAHDNKADFMDFFCSSKIYAKSLKDLGFNDADSETPVFILPIDNSRKSINWAYKIINPEFPPKADQPQAGTLKKEDWFIVKADGDKDRPQS